MEDAVAKSLVMSVVFGSIKLGRLQLGKRLALELE